MSIALTCSVILVRLASGRCFRMLLIARVSNPRRVGASGVCGVVGAGLSGVGSGGLRLTTSTSLPSTLRNSPFRATGGGYQFLMART